MINTKNCTWQPLNDAKNVPDNVRDWLDDTQSLSAKLKQKFDTFSVNIHHQAIKAPHQNEQILLKTHAETIVREVELLGDGQVVVFARSVIPITFDTQYLLNIGDKPLGEVLFNDPKISRGALQITHCNGLWGRRSTFTLGWSRILVSEFFLDNLYA